MGKTFAEDSLSFNGFLILSFRGLIRVTLGVRARPLPKRLETNRWRPVLTLSILQIAVRPENMVGSDASLVRGLLGAGAVPVPFRFWIHPLSVT